MNEYHAIDPDFDIGCTNTRLRAFVESLGAVSKTSFDKVTCDADGYTVVSDEPFDIGWSSGRQLQSMGYTIDGFGDWFDGSYFVHFHDSEPTNYPITPLPQHYDEWCEYVDEVFDQ